MNVKPENLGSIDLSAYADPVMDELVSGEPELDNSILIDLARKPMAQPSKSAAGMDVSQTHWLNEPVPNLSVWIYQHR